MTRRRFKGERLILAAVVSLPLFGVQAARAAQDTWTGVERVVAVGDVHGDYEHFVTVIRLAGLIDADANWSGGKAHLVQTGDVLDRGPDSRKVMDLLMKLEGQARRAGGRVHALIGNDEAMNVYGDLSYVSPGEFAAFQDEGSQEQAAAEAEAGYPPGYAEHRRQLGPEGRYGRWIRGHNAVIKIDDTVFLHGGIAPKYAGHTIRQINNQVREELRDFSRLPGGIVEDVEGPLWYRGMAEDEESVLEAHVAEVLENLKAERIVIGHTFCDGAVTPRFGGKVLQIDIGLARLYDTLIRIACLVIEGGKPYALHQGVRLELPADSGKDMLRYLKQAATLDPPPSSLLTRISRLEASLAANAGE
jgi:hypothetical protein